MRTLIPTTVLLLTLGFPTPISANDPVTPEQARIELCEEFEREAMDGLSAIKLG
jgi:hypothetical protein